MLTDTIAVTTGFFTIHLPIKDHILSRETARLVLIFRKESAGWKITHSSISIPYYLVREGEVYPLKELTDRNQKLEEVIAERTIQLSEANDKLQQTNEELTMEIALRKLAEEALQASEERYRKLSDDMPLYISAFMPDGTLTYVNNALAELEGVEPDKLIGVNFLSMLTPDDLAKLNKQLDSLSPEQPIETHVQVRKRQHADDRWQQWTNRAFFDDKGCPVSYQAIGQDITERKQAEEALKLSEEKFRLSFMTSLDASYWCTLEDGKILEVNPVFDDVFGYARDEVIGRTSLELGLYVDPDDCARMLSELEANGPIKDLELKGRKKSGDLITISLSVSKMLIKDQQYILGVIRDITENKRKEEEKKNLEERLLNAEKMEMMGKMAGRVAHDLNNVLGVLSGYSELLEERLPTGNPLRQYAANIQKSSIRAAAIVEDLLTLTRRGVRVMEPSSLNRIIANLFTTPEFDKLVAYHPDVIVKTNMAKDLLNVSGSPVHLEKTILNLVSNAVEAIIGKGEVEIKTENRYLDKAIQGYQTVKEGDYVVLTVSDTGKGIPVSELKKIFEPFYTKKSMGRSGTGLGLAIVWGTVQDHHGYIDVQSIEENGSTFTLHFPATREESEGKVTPKTPFEQYIGHGELVLVVDDVEEQRNVATAMLTQLCYQVDAVSSGEDAVEYIRSKKADILVLDMIMEPGIDGLETYEQIIQVNPHQKAIIVSGFSETERTKEAQKLGAGAYVKKPYLKEKIGVAIRDELARE